MDSEWHATAIKRQRINELISEIASIISHAELSYNNLNSVFKLHKESGCQKDCFDGFPHPQTFVLLVVDLNSILQELGVQVAAGSPHSLKIQQLILARTHLKIETAENLFAQALACIQKFCSQPKKCGAKKTIYRYFNN